MTKRILHLPLKKIYFDQIKSGEKLFEYRETTDYWKKRLLNRTYDEVHIKSGYPKANDSDRIIIRPWKGYEVKKIVHPHFDNNQVEVFAIIVN